MHRISFAFLTTICALQSASEVKAQDTPPVAVKPSSQLESKADSKTDPGIAEKLLNVKRIFVDSFGEDALSKSLHAMVISALTGSKQFIVTENKEKADAVLKGAAIEKTSQEFHSLGEGTAVSSASGGHSSNISGSAAGGAAQVSGSSHGGFIARSMAAEDSVASTETINDARLAVRLVAADGDVLWTTTQESKGAKYKGATADVADKMVKQLIKDIERLKKQ
jgi:curli biogenesis system outer membrane secretion channel CsgG